MDSVILLRPENQNVYISGKMKVGLRSKQEICIQFPAPAELFLVVLGKPSKTPMLYTLHRIRKNILPSGFCLDYVDSEHLGKKKSFTMYLYCAWLRGISLQYPLSTNNEE